MAEGRARVTAGLLGRTSFDKELLTSILLIGAFIGALAAGRIADRAGRRLTVLGTAALSSPG